MIRPIATLALAGLLALVAAGCPEPEAVGHAPKQQIDMAQERLDKASAKVSKGLDEAAKAVDDSK